jgi:hypothetical protein
MDFIEFVTFCLKSAPSAQSPLAGPVGPREGSGRVLNDRHLDSKAAGKLVDRFGALYPFCQLRISAECPQFHPLPSLKPTVRLRK